MKIRKKLRVSEEIPTCSMADIAFLLIIFFLVTTTMNMDKGLGLVLPGIGVEKKIPKTNICNVWINAFGQVMVAGEMMEIPKIRGEIKRRLEENDKLIVSLKTDPDTKYGTFVDVLDQLKLAEAPRISLAVPD
ncbi:MAG: ExbD/TolR family protein [bacterium]